MKNFSFINFLPPWVETNIQPAFYDKESGTCLQQTARMYAKVNQLVRHFNCLAKETKETVEDYIARFVALKDFVDTYFENLDVQEEVNTKLDAMVEDGTLAEIINEELFTDLETEVEGKLDKTQPQFGSNLEYERYGRIVDETFRLRNDVNGYYNMQGGIAIDDNTYVFLTPHYSGIGTYADEICKIRKINLTTGEVLATKNVALGHGNGMCYDPSTSRYYVAPAHGNIADTGYSNTIITLDADFNYLQSNTVSVNFDSLSIDENGTLYAATTYKGSGVAVYELDKSDFSIQNTIVLDMPVANNIGTGQDMCVRNGYIYYLQYRPNAIFVFDMEGNNIENYTIKDNEFYPLGELENISALDDGTLIIGTTKQPTGNLYAFENVIRVNPIKGICIDKSDYLYRSMNDPFNQVNLYVDPDSTAFAPDGTADKPFKCIDEAIELKLKNPIVLILTDNKTYYVSRINSFNGTIGYSTGVTIATGVDSNNLRIRNSNIYFNYTAQLPPILAEKVSNVYLYHNNLNDNGAGYLVKSTEGSNVVIEGVTISPVANLDDYLFIANHGSLTYGSGNVDMTTSVLSAITKWFDGDINFTEPFPIFNGTLSKGDDALAINNGNIGAFKQFDIKFNDYGERIIPARNDTFAECLFNMSSSGSGTSKFKDMRVKLTSGAISVDKAGEFSVSNADGSVSINTSPTSSSILRIYGM